MSKYVYVDHTGCLLNPPIELPETNADRIRQMSDEELADYFAKFETKCYKRAIPEVVCDTKRFAEQHLDWLKQEVAE